MKRNYRIGKYVCPNQRMSTDCVYIGSNRKSSYISGNPKSPGKKLKTMVNRKASVKLPFDGVTTNNSGHTHRYRVHKNKSVSMYNAIHPDINEIKHNHKYIGKWPNGYVDRKRSSCYPCRLQNPKTGRVENGSDYHSHNLTKQINDMTRYWKPSMPRGTYEWIGNGDAPIGAWMIDCQDGNNSFSANCGNEPAGPGNPCSDNWDGEQLSCTKLSCPECPGEAHLHFN